MEEKEIKNKHWSEILAEKIIEENKRPYIITSGITTSGEVHLGTVCEFLYPSTIKKQLELMGHKAEFYFIADIFDAFDAVPLPMAKFQDQLTPHLGKPLCDVPDPLKCCKSFGEHYLNELISIMEKLDVHPKIITAIDLYKQGHMDKYAVFFLENEVQAKEILARTSMKTVSPDWSPLMPVCANCGRIATTMVTTHVKDRYVYNCIKDVKYTKGCGHMGKNKISDLIYKLAWRL
ncbi:hypothetical protein HY570_01285, partial [Candidatus Micrarchaeota archaeon]|nr:hypothetical protein [Candidatus Micrarchaeota archaeon]